MKIPDPVQVGQGQDKTTTQVAQQSLVLASVVRWENGAHVGPFANLGSDACTALVFGVIDQVMERKKILGLESSVDYGVPVAFGTRCGYTEQPVLDPYDGVSETSSDAVDRSQVK